MLAVIPALPSLAAAPAASEPFFPPETTLILLTGVPGDTESEEAYRDQLQAWLELAASARRISKIIVLNDNPDTLRLSEKPEVQVLKGDRAHFLGLSATMANTTNPLVVIAWGHGGNQGGTPVLHVRGPRLTPHDFVELVDQVPARPSHWVLWFRGSGAFGSQLAGPQRKVLTSECETSFASDPVGIGSLLKIIRSDPGMSFVKLAEKLGHETAAWYSDRNLARTEEPTLWLSGEKPRLLAEVDSEQRLGSLPQELDTQPGNNQTADLKKGASEAESDSSATSPIWRTIKKVSEDKSPGVDALVLRQNLSCTLGSRPAIVTEQEQFVQVLTAAGRQYGDFDVSYSPPREEIEFLDCEVLRPDGKLVRLDPDSIVERGEQSVGDYQLGRRKFFSLPGVTPGAVLHVRYRSQWNDFPLPRISLELPLVGDLPVQESMIEVSVPKKAPFHFGFGAISAPDPLIKQTSYSTTFCWQLSNLPPQQYEVLTRPHSRACLLLSTFPDWSSFGEWYSRIIQFSGEVTPEIATKAKELMRDSHSEKEKVLAVYNFVSALRYVAVPLGINSVRPHAAGNVLQNQFGDCKDKANLFTALLQAANIEAHLVLVPRFSQAYEGIPGLAFNHAISQVRLGSEVLWVDTTDEVCRFGLLPPGDPGRKVLVIDGHATGLTQLPDADPVQNHLQMRGEIHWGASADGLLTDLKVAASGYPDYELRMAARETRERRSSLPLLAASFRPSAGSFALEHQTATAVLALAEDFVWQAKGNWFGLCASVDGKYDLHSPFWLPKEWDLALNRKQTPLFLNEGYPMTLDEDFEFTLPVKGRTVVLPPSCTGEEEPLRWRVEWARIGDDKLVARFQAQLARGELSQRETSALQQQLRSLWSALGRDAVFVCR